MQSFRVKSGPLTTFWTHQCVPQSGNSSESQCPEVSLGVRYVGIIDKITVHVIQQKFQPPSPPQKSSWLRVSIL